MKTARPIITTNAIQGLGALLKMNALNANDSNNAIFSSSIFSLARIAACNRLRRCCLTWTN